MGDWQIYHIHYRTKKFGTEDEYNPEDHVMIVSTQGGPKDAEETCKRYHPGVKIDAVLDKLSETANVNNCIVESVKRSKTKKKK